MHTNLYAHAYACLCTCRYTRALWLRSSARPTRCGHAPMQMYVHVFCIEIGDDGLLPDDEDKQLLSEHRPCRPLWLDSIGVHACQPGAGMYRGLQVVVDGTHAPAHHARTHHKPRMCMRTTHCVRTNARHARHTHVCARACVSTTQCAHRTHSHQRAGSIFCVRMQAITHALACPVVRTGVWALCAEMCLDMCMNMCTDRLADMCLDMCMDMCIDMCVDVYIDMCIDMCIIDMCIDMCIDICVDMRVGVYRQTWQICA